MGLGGVGFLGVEVREVFAVPPVPLQLSPRVLWGVCEPERSDGSRSEGPGLIMQESPPVASLVCWCSDCSEALDCPESTLRLLSESVSLLESYIENGVSLPLP